MIETEFEKKTEFYFRKRKNLSVFFETRYLQLFSVYIFSNLKTGVVLSHIFYRLLNYNMQIRISLLHVHLFMSQARTHN